MSVRSRTSVVRRTITSGRTRKLETCMSEPSKVRARRRLVETDEAVPRAALEELQRRHVIHGRSM